MHGFSPSRAEGAGYHGWGTPLETGRGVRGTPIGWGMAWVVHPLWGVQGWHGG